MLAGAWNEIFLKISIEVYFAAILLHAVRRMLVFCNKWRIGQNRRHCCKRFLLNRLTHFFNNPRFGMVVAVNLFDLFAVTDLQKQGS
jgi:hypothetical protein